MTRKFWKLAGVSGVVLVFLLFGAWGIWHDVKEKGWLMALCTAGLYIIISNFMF